MIKNFKYYCFLALLLSLLCLNKTYAFTVKNVYAFYHCPKSEIAEEIKIYIEEKKHRLYKYDEEKGFYYFQPRSWGTYPKGNYIILALKQIKNDSFLYTQSVWGTEYNKTKLLNYLKEQGFTYVEIKDEKLEDKLSSLANDFINSYKNSDFYGEKKIIANNQPDKEEDNDANKTGLSEEKLKLLQEKYGEIAQDEQILLALDLLKNSKQSFIIDSLKGKNESQKPIEIGFRNLSGFGKQYRNFDGLGWLDDGLLYIYIHEKYRNAPPEAIASLISNLEVHQDEDNSINEEAYAITREIITWKELIETNPSAAKTNSALVKRENNLLKKFGQGNNIDNVVKEFVSSHSDYKNLPETSVGFGALKAETVKSNKKPCKASKKIENPTKNGVNFEPYLEKIQDKIKANWNPPKQRKTKRIKVRFSVDKKGNLLNPKIIKSSKNRNCDNSALNALIDSAPFEPLPAEYNENTIDIEFTFDYNVYKLKK